MNNFDPRKLPPPPPRPQTRKLVLKLEMPDSRGVSSPGHTLEGSFDRKPKPAPRELTHSEKQLATIKEQLDQREAELNERESYIEHCEDELVRRSLELTEREARVEQDEEDLQQRLDRAS